MLNQQTKQANSDGPGQQGQEVQSQSFVNNSSEGEAPEDFRQGKQWYENGASKAKHKGQQSDGLNQREDMRV